MQNLKELPKPTGEYLVGITHSEFSYKGIEEEQRKIPVTIFFPAEDKEEKERHPYAFKDIFDWNDNYKSLHNTLTHCYSGVPVSCRQPDYPVIIYNHGYGSYEMTNTVLCSDLASCGYIVVSAGHPGESNAVRYQDGTVVKIDPQVVKSMQSKEFMDQIMPLFEQFKTIDENDDATLIEHGRRFFALQDRFGQRVKIWASDTEKTADHLERMHLGEIPSIFQGKIRLTKGFGCTGHSFGGSIAIQVLQDDNRFRCGINVDGGNFGDVYGVDIHKPMLSIGNPYIWKMLKAVFLANSADAFHLTVGNTDHLSFTDFMFIGRGKEDNDRLGQRDADNMREVLTQYHLAFFKKYLLGNEVGFGDLGFEDTRFYEKRAVHA